ncbi:MAG: hypothetical protein ACR2NZ_24955 [Rubripirellula sp.]
MNSTHRWFVALVFVSATLQARAEVGDPQLRTDHAWYPGELAISTFERLAQTQAEVYKRETGRDVESDQDKALASWYWRNLHYAHCQEGTGDYFDTGFERSDWNREYWHGLFAHGMSLCGTTHSQWSAEFNHLLGHCRSRCVGVTGHSSFEVFLTGGDYGEGRWALLDHDVSTVIFHPQQQRLLSIEEILRGKKQLRDNDFLPKRQQGWRIAGLHPRDVDELYDTYTSASYLAGYEGPTPMVHLRQGESFWRYLNPGLKDGQTFVFWGLNRQQAIRGPERDRTWVNQPQNMYGSSQDARSHRGQMRYGNAVYSYRPRFEDGTYREGVISESEHHVTFEFKTPYVIAAQPTNDQPWGIYDDGCTSGLVISGQLHCDVAVSTDSGSTWKTRQHNQGDLDWTDTVKGHKQYLLRISKGANELGTAEVEIATVCQINPTTVPRLHPGMNTITYAASGHANVSAGPNLDQALSHRISGNMDAPEGITLELETPRGETAVAVHAASHNLSGNPPADVDYQIDCSVDGGQWQPIVSDWTIERRTPEPPDLWSQSFAYGKSELGSGKTAKIRFHNSGRKPYRRVEAHLTYRVANPTRAVVTFGWLEPGDDQLKTFAQTVSAGTDTQVWNIPAGDAVNTKWVEIASP